jgi:nucleoid-associated protein YgaU
MAVIGGGLGLALYTRYQGDSVAPSNEAPIDTSADPGVGVGGSWQAVDPPTTNSGNGQAPAPVTNEEWGRNAINWLIASGYDPATSDAAIRKYLESAALSAREFTLITLALGHLGATPYPLPAPIFAPPTLPGPPATPVPPKTNPTPPVKPPTKFRYHTVKPGETLSGLAKKYYKNGHNWGPIFNANKKGTIRADKTKGMISNPNLIRVGWKLIIP